MTDKDTIREWMRKFCFGYRAGKTLKAILPDIRWLIPGLSERTLRELLSELKHEGFVGALSEGLRWYIPEVSSDYEEIEMAKRSWKEMRSRAMSMLTDCDKQIKALEDRLRVATQGQAVLFEGR